MRNKTLLTLLAMVILFSGITGYMVSDTIKTIQNDTRARVELISSIR